MSNKFLKDVIIIVVGKQAEEIVDLLDSKKHINEFIIAKKMDITINQTRNILYKLSDYGLVSSIRKKDKKKGWYTYFWKIEIVKSLEFLRDILLKRVNQIENQIKSRETKKFYICERCSIEVSEENALLNDFTCNECGDIFTLKDNERFLKELRRNKYKLEKDLKSIAEELKKETQKIEKQKFKELEKEKQEKAKKRAKTMKQKKRLLKKEMKKQKPGSKAKLKALSAKSIKRKKAKKSKLKKSKKKTKKSKLKKTVKKSQKKVSKKRRK